MLRILSAGLAALLLLALPAAAQEQAGEAAHERVTVIDEPLELLFVQTAKSVRYDGETLVLEGLAPVTIFFADRPQRLSGHFSNADFVDLWTQSADSFAADPPNAALSFVDRVQEAPVVVELQDVGLEGDSLRYKVRVLEGELPAEAGSATLFIDPWVWRPPRPYVGPDPGWVRCHWNAWGGRVCHRYW